MKLNICFFTKDNELLEKYNEIWDKVSNTIKKGFDSKPVYNEKYFKTKMKSCEGKVNTNFLMIKCQRRVLITFVY